jgi:hypothetical protein
MTRFPRLFLVALAVLAVGLACLPAEAGQPGGRAGGRAGGFAGMGMMGGMGGLNLLMVAQNAQVQEKCGLTDAQKEAVAEIAKGARGAGRGAGRGARLGPDATAEERAAARAERAKAQAALEEKIKKALGDKAACVVLTAAGLALQPGPSALGNAEVAKAVGLSPETQAKVAEVVQASNKETMAAMQEMRDSGTERGVITEKLAASRKVTNTKIFALLSAEDKEKVEKARKAAEGITLGGRRGGGRGGRTGGAAPGATQ